MKMSIKYYHILLLLVLSTVSYGQKPGLTTVIGEVKDATTGELLPFVDVYFAGTTVGTNTDVNGYYKLSSQWGSDKVVANYLGYEPDTIQIIPGKRNAKIDFGLGEGAIVMNTVEIKAKKQRYKNKDNPAVQLIKDILEHREENRTGGLDYYQYEKYEKIELDINNITDDFRQSRPFKKLQFIFNYVDTSEINGKPYLPIYFREIMSDVYARKDPEAEREYQKAIKITGLQEYLNDQTISAIMDRIYVDVDIYDNRIELLAQDFTSPISPLAPSIYKYYILDTIEYKGQQVYDLAFLPRNSSSFAFKGNMYVSQDGNFTVMKVKMGVDSRINLNFVRDMEIVQEFEKVNGAWIIAKDEIVVDYALGNKGTGFFGRRSVERRDHIINEKIPDDKFSGSENIIVADDAKEKGDEYWGSARFEDLTETEVGVYHMVDTLQTVPAFRRTLDLVKLGLTGYYAVGGIDIGPVGAFYSFNDVEGFRLRFGGQTNMDFNKKWRFEGYGAYGFKDKRFKYFGSAQYSFNKDYDVNPKHFLKFSYQRETTFPGQVLQFVNEDNFFLSFRRGRVDQMLFFNSFKFDYLKETKTPFDFGIRLENKKTEPYGALKFNEVQSTGDTLSISDIHTNEISFNIRYAPNEEFWQGYTYRTPLFNKYPIINLNYTAGIKGPLGGDYNYHKINLSIFKRFYMSVLGQTNVLLTGEKIFGKNLPFVLLQLPQANQTYSYQIYSYNMMNFLEFVSDEYVSINVEHFFNGFFLNKIPLLKKLKLRELITAKVLYGQLSDRNNPAITENLFELPTRPVEGGGEVTSTYTLDNRPYIEGSIGVSNVLKFARVDFVKRFTHLDHPDVPTLWGVKGLGIRVRVKLEF